MTRVTPSRPSNWRNLAAAFAAISVFGFAFGMSYPLLSLILEKRGVSTELIGINAAMSPIGILLSASLIPVAARRLGQRNVAIIAALFTAFLILAYKIFDRLDVWFMLRLMQGVSISTLFVLSETWIVRFSDSAKRGRIVALYGSILSASFGAGPALVGWIGIEGWAPFIIGSLVILAGIYPLSMVDDKAHAAPHETPTSNVVSFIPKAPMLLFAVGIFAVFDAATLSLLPVYGVNIGLSLQTATSALTALIIGNVVLQLPIGWCADMIPKRTLMAILAAISLVGLVLLPSAMGHWPMWPLLLIVGATGYGMYTVALASLGDRFDGEELIAGNAAFASLWGIGALTGSVITGWSMAGFGPHALPYTLAAFFAAFIAAYFWRISTLKT